MTGNTFQANWKKHYTGEVQKQTFYYEQLNAENAKNTIVRKITPEEKEIYENNLKKQNKQYFNPFRKDNKE